MTIDAKLAANVDSSTPAAADLDIYQLTRDVADRFRHKMGQLTSLFDEHDALVQALHKESSALRSRCQDLAASRLKSGITLEGGRLHTHDTFQCHNLSKSSVASALTGRSYTFSGRKSDTQEVAIQSHNLVAQAEEIDEIEDVVLRFRKLDCTGSGLVSLEQFFLSSDLDDAEQLCAENLEEAIILLNRLLGAKHKGKLSEISVESFKVIMLLGRQELDEALGSERAQAIIDMREVCAKASMKKQLGQIIRASTLELQHMHRTLKSPTFCYHFLEPIVAVLICLNAVFLGVSLDQSPDWHGWKVCELLFCIAFSIELIIRVHRSGFQEHFFGKDWCWNFFDFLFVVIGIFDTLVAYVLTSINFNYASISVVRIFRLLRVFRLARLIRFKQFKELSLMVRGLIAGMRTMFWAIFFLFGIVYVMGVLLRQIMDPKLSPYACDEYENSPLRLRNDFFSQPANCNRGAWKLHEYSKLMFRNVPSAMAFMWSCFTDGCNAPDGTPMIWVWWDSHGAWLVLGYTFAYVLVVFGIFNLVLAIFVENTMRDAHLDRTMRTPSEKVRHRLHVACKIQRLLVQLCKATDEHSNQPAKEIKSLATLQQSWSPWKLFRRQKSTTPTDHLDFEAEHFDMHVNRETFEAILENNVQVQQLLEDLEVSYACRENMFEILDADDNGFLSISEIADGVMRLRGGQVDKSDAISCLLMTRALQKRFRRFEDKMQREHLDILDAIQDLHANFMNRKAPSKKVGLVLESLKIPLANLKQDTIDVNFVKQDTIDL